MPPKRSATLAPEEEEEEPSASTMRFASPSTASDFGGGGTPQRPWPASTSTHTDRGVAELLLLSAAAAATAARRASTPASESTSTPRCSRPGVARSFSSRCSFRGVTTWFVRRMSGTPARAISSASAIVWQHTPFACGPSNSSCFRARMPLLWALVCGRMATAGKACMSSRSVRWFRS